MFAYAEAQTTTAAPQATEYLITAQDNRTSLFEMIQSLKENHGI
ncbi:hypothetical protein [Nonlabens marinus]|uniref:Uncharacterized protein n=1 Tax=Nonlabens marinus S1-08 TaxID=1454201 RepID=W8VVV7_9FLAO|nr:hypothetical protein [Nonlabens marinus]BAO55793.1 hypothetical protein NMS_1784 [Nonlabens marinus S1-08]